MALPVKYRYVTQAYDILSIKGYQNCIVGLKVTVILMNGWILPIGGLILNKMYRSQGNVK